VLPSLRNLLPVVVAAVSCAAREVRGASCGDRHCASGPGSAACACDVVAWSSTAAVVLNSCRTGVLDQKASTPSGLPAAMHAAADAVRLATY
jgi:hypothetical protein